jgi:hypothetical protein
VLSLDTIQNIDVSYLIPDESLYYNTNFFRDVVTRNLVQYPSSSASIHDRIYDVYNGYECGDERMPALIEMGRVIIDKNFKKENLLDFLPKNIPKKVNEDYYL